MSGFACSPCALARRTSASLHTRLRSRDRSRGAVAVEFALIVPILLLLLFGIIQYGWYFYAMQSGTSATGDALRRLTVGACQTTTQRDALLRADLGPALSGSTLASDTVLYAAADGTSSSTPVTGGTATLTVSFATLDLHFPLLPVPQGGIVTRTQTARIENASPASGVSCQ